MLGDETQVKSIHSLFTQPFHSGTVLPYIHSSSCADMYTDVAMDISFALHFAQPDIQSFFYVLFTSCLQWFVFPWILHHTYTLSSSAYVQFLVCTVLVEFWEVDGIKHGVCSTFSFAALMISSLVTDASSGLVCCSALYTTQITVKTW
jgi:hypothetical protein